MEEMKTTVKKNLEQLLHDRRVSRINRAYAVYKLEPNENNLNDLLQLVIKLSRRKLRYQAEAARDFSMEDADDFAQKVALIIWEKLVVDKLEVSVFYEWVMRVIINHGLHLYRDARRHGDKHVPLILQDEDGNEYDNPAVYTTSGSGLGTSFQVPGGLEEDEEIICHLILAKRTQKQIADILDVQVGTIERRIRSLKDRFSLPVKDEEEDVA
jgi:DNA-directed RNA polymerase specialized sigma24 family protein